MQILSPIFRRWAAVIGVLAAAAAAAAVPGSAGAGAGSPTGSAAASVAGKVVVGFRATPTAGVEAAIAARSGATLESLAEPGVALVGVRRGETVTAAIARLRAQSGVAYAVPDYIAHASSYWFPNDRGRGRAADGW